MKRNTRTITVNHQQYVWWYDFDRKCAVIHFSPLHDKTSKITVEFHLMHPSKSDAKYPYIDVFPEYVVMKKDDKEYCVKTIEPKMASLMLSYFSYDAFIFRKKLTYNGLDLLSEMGYTVIKVKEGWYW